MKDVCIVIVNYNGAKYQISTLSSLYAMSVKDFDILIIDNASTDQSVEQVIQQFPFVIMLRQQENYGFAKGCNIGIEYSVANGYQHTLLINNDVEVDAAMLEELLKYSSESTITVPKMYFYNEPKVLWYAGGEIRWNRFETHNIGYGEVDKGQYDSVKEVEFLNGCCVLIHNRIFQKVGLLDENYFMYFEDVDFGLRSQIAGNKVLYIPTAVLWHQVSSSSGGENSITQVYYMNRNRLYFAKKFADRNKIWAYLYTWIKACVKYLFSAVYKKNNRYILKAYMDYFKDQMGKGNYE